MIQEQLIGRIEELKTLSTAAQSPQAELVAVTGRRRIGKTFLVAQAYQQQMVFEVIGTQNGTLRAQLDNFAEQLRKAAKSVYALKPPATWAEAFRQLRDFLETLPVSDHKPVLFFDELPWLAGQKSGFLQAFGYFWNSWASRQRLTVVICGSAASWMIQRVVNDTGGLHNRITRHLHLAPFTLAETEAFLHSRGLFFDRYQIVQLYMAIGGIPHYLKALDYSKTVVQNIDTLCFSARGFLREEFLRLYPSLFPNAEHHVLVVRTLAQKRQGMTRAQLLETTKLANGGNFTTIVNELVQSGFVTEVLPFGKSQKEKIFRLDDEYSLFYLHFIENNKKQGRNLWQHLSQTPAYKSWSGVAFEAVCLKHIEEIKMSLSIAGIYSTVSSFYKKGTDTAPGVQIDMVLDRNDHAVNLFECKFYNEPFAHSKEDADALREKMWRFKAITKTKKHLSWILVTAHGLTSNKHSGGLVSNVLTLDDLFLPTPH
jgi:uncharacterized protein